MPITGLTNGSQDNLPAAAINPAVFNRAMDNKDHNLDLGNSEMPIEGVAGWDIDANDLSGCLQPEFSAEAMLIVQEGVIKQSSPAMAEMSAYATEEILDTCVASFFDTEHIAAVEFLCEHVRQGLEGSQQLEATLVCKSGRRLLTQITAVPCTFDQRPACRLKIRHLGFIPPLLEATDPDGANLFAGIV